MKVVDLLSSAVAQKASDIFLVPGMPFSYKIGSRIVYQSEEKLYPRPDGAADNGALPAGRRTGHGKSKGTW